ncbi:hypothetical protein PS2_012954 [Malus domestica]
MRLTSIAIAAILGISWTNFTLLGLLINTGAILRLLITTGIEFEDEGFTLSLMLFHLITVLVDNAFAIVLLKDGHPFPFLKPNLPGAVRLDDMVKSLGT